MATDPMWYLRMLSESRTYSGFRTPEIPTRIRTMKSWPTFSSSESVAKVFWAHPWFSVWRR